jgi:predicted RNA-binding Zn-ribbon protein involved in translation (DUF1610 family)
MTETDYHCPECRYEPLEVKKSVENNEVVKGGYYCPDCGEDFAEDTVLRWDDVDFPYWIDYEPYDDNWQLYRDFLYATGLHEEAVGMPPLRDMKYTVFTVWFKITEDGEVEGPYDSRGGELI